MIDNKDLFCSYIPYMINGYLKWCKQNQKTPIAEVYIKNLNIESLNQEVACFDLSSKNTKNLKLYKKSIVFITSLNSKEISLTIPYENIVKIFTKEEGFGVHLGEILDITYEPSKITKKSNFLKIVE